MEAESLTLGIGGWALAQIEGVEGFVRVRFQEHPSGRLGIGEVALLSGASADALRAIPIGRLEAHANSPKVAAVIRARIADAPPEIERAIDDLWSLVTPLPTAASPHVGLDESGEITAITGALGWGDPRTEPQTFVFTKKKSLRLAIPKTQKKPDTFYQRVAEVFSSAAAVSTRPAMDIAEANGIPVTTVHQWVKEARRRGLLTPGDKGKGMR